MSEPTNEHAKEIQRLLDENTVRIAKNLTEDWADLAAQGKLDTPRGSPRDIDDLPFTDEQKKLCLEWLAMHLWRIQEAVGCDIDQAKLDLMKSGKTPIIEEGMQALIEDAAKYQRLLSELGLARAVDVRDEFVPDQDVATLFAACDVVVQPYLTATYSGVAKIAFHFERPLILTDVGGLGELVDDGHAGLVVPPRDPEALAEAIHRFFDEHLADDLTEGVV